MSALKKLLSACCGLLAAVALFAIMALTLVDVNEQPLSLIHRSGFEATLGSERIVADWSALAQVPGSADQAPARQLSQGPDA